MAIARNGLQGTHTGKIGNTVYYMLNGKNVAREIGITLKEPTEAKLKSQLATKICSQFLSQLKVFINLGFSIEKQGTDKNAFNLAQQYNRNKIIKGDYPDLEIAYDQVILSKGNLKAAQDWSVTQIPGGLKYSWATHLQMPWPESTDQVMMLAYFPAENEAVYTLFGSSRLSGTAYLEIPESLQGKYMETYMSFVAADRSQLADSTYTGAFNGGLNNNQGEQLLLF
jgi:hypothetical protein